ncbi:hypothetical protein [Eubacterium callanderi]|uniref:hypothetical protein n=1 Tax=Eubacterium callanderi TaxID=53442 RepID=UPI0022E1ED55|nr:hypothetical protein [Eubacterium callanderi]
MDEVILILYTGVFILLIAGCVEFIFYQRKTISGLQDQLIAADNQINEIILENKKAPGILYDSEGVQYRKMYCECGAIIYGKSKEVVENIEKLNHTKVITCVQLPDFDYQ